MDERGELSAGLWALAALRLAVELSPLAEQGRPSTVTYAWAL